MTRTIEIKNADLAKHIGAIVEHPEIVQPIREFNLYQEAQAFMDEMLCLMTRRDEDTDDKEVYEAYQQAHNAASRAVDAVVDAYVLFTTARTLGAIQQRKRQQENAGGTD